MIVWRAEAPMPVFDHDLIGNVMIAGHIEERHLKFANEGLEFLPLPVEFGLFFALSFDQIADTEDEFRLQQVQLTDGLSEDAGSVSAGAVGDDGKLEVVGVVFEVKMCPGFWPGWHIAVKGSIPGVTGPAEKQ